MPRTGYRDGFVRARGLDFHYLDWGDPDNPPLVLLHNTTGNAHRWDPVAAELATDWRVIALDCRNHGDSDVSMDPADTFVLVDDVAAIVDTLGLGRFGLMGHSMGGRTAMTYAGLHPDRLHFLVIEDMAPTAPTSGSGRMANYLATLPESYDSVDAYIQEYLRPNVKAAPEEELRTRTLFARIPLPGGRMRLKYVAWPRREDPTRPSVWDVVQHIACPTLEIWGTDSDILDDDLLRRMHETIRDFRDVPIADAGHSVHLDQHDAFMAALRPFLAEQRARLTT